MNPKILLIEDDPNITQAFTDAFGGDFEVVTAASGERAIEILPTLDPPPEVILTDYKFPLGIDGIKTAQIIKGLNSYAAIHLLTGFADDEKIREAARNVGITMPVLAKPYSSVDLKAAIHRSITRRTDEFAKEVFPEPLTADCELETMQVLENRQGEGFVIKVGQEKTITSSCFFSHEVDDDNLQSQALDISSCLASAAGCDLACAFCASGHLPYAPLTIQELLCQANVHLTQGSIGQKIWLTGIPWECSYMGPGEALRSKNYSQVIESIRQLHAAFQKNSVPRRVKFTISTAGLVSGLQKLLKEELPKGLTLRLQISIHGDQKWREKHMPRVAQVNPLSEIWNLIPRLRKKLGHKIWLNCAYWTGSDDVENCSPEKIQWLTKAIINQIGRENVIVFITHGNPVERFMGIPASNEKIQDSLEFLRKWGIDARPFKQTGWFRCGTVQDNIPDFARR